MVRPLFLCALLALACTDDPEAAAPPADDVTLADAVAPLPDAVAPLPDTVAPLPDASPDPSDAPNDTSLHDAAAPKDAEVPVDVGAPDVDDACGAACDDALQAPDAVEDTAGPPPVVKLGTNTTGSADPATFVEAGETLPVVFGPQGAWMIVLAVGTNAYPPEVKRLRVKASIALDDGIPREIDAKPNQDNVTVGADGLSYVLNTWLIVDAAGDPTPWQGKTGVLQVTLTPLDGGAPVTASVTVTLKQS